MLYNICRYEIPASQADFRGGISTEDEFLTALTKAFADAYILRIEFILSGIEKFEFFFFENRTPFQAEKMQWRGEQRLDKIRLCTLYGIKYGGDDGSVLSKAHVV